ncbi:MAG TPA: hypothetical protein VJU61_17670 [Polyangiaceae bacterium]|nr:hypothetical protein [Polyangiaceae bacterium]
MCITESARPFTERSGSGRALRIVVATGLLALPARAQQPASPWAQPPPPPISSVGPSAPARSASDFESGTLYVTSTAYGLGVGIWLGAELGLDDPGLRLIPPALFGVAAPVAAYIWNQPRLPRGVPGALSAGLFIGAGEGLGLAALQMTSADDPWGALAVSRVVVIGSTVGGIGGYVLGELQRPSPNISAFASSGVVWGSLVGSAIGFGASAEGVGFSEANDTMALGGLIGFNAGLVVTMGLSTVFVPSPQQISWMWLGAGVGAVASLPVYLFYLGDDTPPAKRGLLFSATMTTLGILVGGVFGPGIGELGLGGDGPRWASIDYVTPAPVEGGLGFQLGGTLF